MTYFTYYYETLQFEMKKKNRFPMKSKARQKSIQLTSVKPKPLYCVSNDFF